MKARIDRIAITRSLSGRTLGIVFVGALANLILCPETKALEELDRSALIKAARSVVRIEAIRGTDKVQIGTGTVLSEGEVVTACHVIRNASAIYVSYRGQRRFATNHRAMQKRDVCVFSVVGLKARPATIRPAAELQIGEQVSAMGFSGGASVKWRTGTVERVHHLDGSAIVQTTTPFTSGASGGPLFDARGSIVGLLSFRTRGHRPQFFAVPVEWAMELVEQVADNQPKETNLSDFPFWNRQRSELPFFMRASALEEEQNWTSLRALCAVWQIEEPLSADPGYVESRIDERLGDFAMAQYRLLKAVRRDESHVLAWESLVRVGLLLNDFSGARSAHMRLQALNEHVAQRVADARLK